jgi:hypothetical protein
MSGWLSAAMRVCVGNHPALIADLVRVLEAAGGVGNGYGHTHRGTVSDEAPAPREALAVYDKAEHIDGSEAL